MKEKNKEEYRIFSEVLRDLKYMPFKYFDAEFMVEDGKVLFTDLTIKGREDNEYANELRKEIEQKNNRIGNIEKGEI